MRISDNKKGRLSDPSWLIQFSTTVVEKLSQSGCFFFKISIHINNFIIMAGLDFQNSYISC